MFSRNVAGIFLGGASRLGQRARSAPAREQRAGKDARRVLLFSLPRRIRARHQHDRQQIKNKHQSQISFCFHIRAREFFPREHAP